MLLGSFFGSTGAAAQGTTTVRVGDSFSFKPYFLGQVDQAGFTQNRCAGQAAGFNLRRLWVGSRLEIADQVELGVIWNSGRTPGNILALARTASQVQNRPAQRQPRACGSTGKRGNGD